MRIAQAFAYRLAAGALLLLCGCRAASAPVATGGWRLVETGTRASLRGVSASGARVAWASGSGATFLRTADGGATWRVDSVPGASGVEFRDVQAFGADTALLLTAGQPARIYRTTDGGRSWRITYANPDSTAFFDGMAFWNARDGLAFSDPVAGRFLIVLTSDGGATWREVPRSAAPVALPGEAAFAASGTAIAVAEPDRAWIVTGGGPVARVLRTADRGRTWVVDTLPIRAGTASTGAFGVAFLDAARGVAVGGDYQRELDTGEIARTSDGGRSWAAVPTPVPTGLREGVVAVRGAGQPLLVVVGAGGTGWSGDGGATWVPSDTLRFHAVDFASPRNGWAVGANGRVARWLGPLPAVR